MTLFIVGFILGRLDCYFGMFVVCLILLLSGCDLIKQDQPEALTHDLVVGSTYQKETSQFCARVGYCFGCGMQIGGEYGCGYGFRFCNGSQKAIYNYTPSMQIYERGSTSFSNKKEFIKNVGECI